MTNAAAAVAQAAIAQTQQVKQIQKQVNCPDSLANVAACRYCPRISDQLHVNSF